MAVLGDSGGLLGVLGRPTRKRSRKVGDGVFAGGAGWAGVSSESSEWFGFACAGGRK